MSAKSNLELNIFPFFQSYIVKINFVILAIIVEFLSLTANTSNVDDGRRDIFRMYLTLHSYSQMWLVPWGYTYAKPSDYWELASVAKKAIGAISKIHGTDYQLGPSADLLYPTSGTFT